MGPGHRAQRDIPRRVVPPQELADRNQSPSWGRRKAVLRRPALGYKTFSGEAVSGPPWGILGAPGTVLRHHGPNRDSPPGNVGGVLGAILGPFGTTMGSFIQVLERL